MNFFIYAIGADSRDRGKFKYKFPANVVGIQEVFLDEILSCHSPKLQENILNEQERQCLYDLVVGEKPIDIESTCQYVSQAKHKKNPLTIFMSSDFLILLVRFMRINTAICPLQIFSGP